MKVAGCQWDIAWEDRAANFRMVDDLLDGVEQADLVVLPEMFGTGFSMNVPAIAEKEPSETEAFLRDLAKRKGGAALGGLVRADADGWGRNELIAFDSSGEELTRYQKIRTFRYTRESDHFRSGTEIEVFRYRDWKIAPFICYDLRFPELFRAAAGRGAELFIVISSWPTARVDHWITLLRARAIENLAYVVGVNRCGSDPANEYPGRSLIVDPLGKVLADGGDEAGVCEATLDREILLAWRNEFPALQDIGR